MVRWEQPNAKINRALGRGDRTGRHILFFENCSLTTISAKAMTWLYNYADAALGLLLILLL